jgi:hypothetical protein
MRKGKTFTAETQRFVGRTPWSAADALVGLMVGRKEPAGGPAADRGVRPTKGVDSSREVA